LSDADKLKEKKENDPVDHEDVKIDIKEGEIKEEIKIKDVD
jgi:hypothetical protein